MLGLTYTDILIIILIYLMVVLISIALYPKLRAHGEPRHCETPEVMKASCGKKNNRYKDSFYVNLFAKSEKEIADEIKKKKENYV